MNNQRAFKVELGRSVRMVADHAGGRLSGNGRSFTQTERKQTVSVDRACETYRLQMVAERSGRV